MSKDINNPRQIAVKKNDKAGIELVNKLQLATLGRRSNIHRKDEKNETDKHDSLIGLTVWDYSGKETIFASDTLKPVDIEEIYHEALMKRENYQFSRNGYKIFGDADAEGKCPARCLMITRQGSYQGRDGRTVEKKLPWRFLVKNGRGIKMKTESGGQYMQSNSFVSEKEVTINLSDADVLELLYDARSFIRLWEDHYRQQFMEATLKAIEDADKNYRNSRNYSNQSKYAAPSKESEKSASKQSNVTAESRNTHNQESSNQQQSQSNYFPNERKPAVPPNSKKMSICFRTNFGDSTDKNLLYANATCYAGNKQSDCIIWFERSKIAPRLNEFTDAMENNKKIQIYYRVDGKDIYFVA